MTAIYSLLLFLGLVALVWFEIRRSERARKRKLTDTFAGREPLTPEQFYQRYYADSDVPPEVVLAIHRILEQELETALPYLQPQDSFAGNLRFLFEFDSMADVALVLAIEKHFQIQIDNQEAEATRTVAELIQLVANMLAKGQQQTRI